MHKIGYSTNCDFFFLVILYNNTKLSPEVHFQLLQSILQSLYSFSASLLHNFKVQIKNSNLFYRVGLGAIAIEYIAPFYWKCFNMAAGLLFNKIKQNRKTSKMFNLDIFCFDSGDA